MTQIEIGNKKYTLKYNNRVIWAIEEAFDGKEMIKILTNVEELNTRDVGVIIWHGIKDDITFDEFADDILLGQYHEAGKLAGEEIVKAFTVKSDQKKK